MSQKSSSKRTPKTGQIDASYTVTKMGIDSAGNHSVWVSFRGERAKKIQTNANLPLTHFDKALTTRALYELSDFLHRKDNPAPRIGTARPRRVSQITKKAPTKRLVKRRRANTDEGYFPNPVEALHATFHYEGKEFNYAVIQRHKNGDVEAVALVPGVEDARLLVRMLNTHAPAGVNFLVMKR
jgi:hypothetical protein